ncbi:hypothetical protein NL108_006532 [Boleophthalmus pectinirostris]|uniref:uncharacterized protein si:ch211-195m9.3 n=1 Tax=Boleophthalmus pectinirostris TaxID=150288 RepID=UPI00243211AE|nr:uncharacterized protein si:ch211-195m9.3 [Boleophthalmus pectinirostris]KAJ0063687.1 hypothetical protein NL108_006532 [Boleophthalmus pectinirostris]
MCPVFCLAIKMMDLVLSTRLVLLLTFGVCVHASVCTSKANGETKDSNSKKILPHSRNQTFNQENCTCCAVHGQASLTDLLSEKVLSCCGLKVYNPLNEICCQSTVLNKPTATAQCCGREAFDEDSQLCCGPNNSKVILNRKSPDHRCCKTDQYNIKTQCCVMKHYSIQVESRFNVSLDQRNAVSKMSQNLTDTEQFGYLCCGANSSKFMLPKESAKHQCCGPDKQFNIETECCCEKNGTLLVTPLSECPASCDGRMHNESAQKITYTDGSVEHLCCGANGSKVMLPKESPKHQCCGPEKQFNIETEYCVEKNGTLQVMPLSQCPGEVDDKGTDPHYNQDVHQSKSKQQNKCHLENQCCGNQVYNASTHICCSGYSHTKGKNIQCCGTDAYDIKSTNLKCCMGSLQNVTSKNALCCGYRLLKKEETCCISESKQLLYSTKEGLQCCGHLYYNTSLWSCCLGKLSPLQQNQTSRKKQAQGSPHLSINNQEKQNLCNKVTLGKVESVSSCSIIFNSVMKINAKEGLVYVEPQHVMVSEDPGNCILPEIKIGKVYFFNRTEVFVNLDNKSVYEALYFIVSMCQQ